MNPASLTELVLPDAVATGPLVEPESVVAERARAAAFVTEHGFPTRKHEDWRYTRLEALLDTTFARVPAGEVALDDESADVLASIPDLGGPRLVYLDGAYVGSASRVDELPVGVHVGDRSAFPDLPLVEDPSDAPYPDGFAALNAALAVAGAVLRVDAGTTVDAPIQVIHLLGAGPDPVLANLRSSIDLGPGATATVVVSARGVAGATGCLNTATRISLAPDAALTHQHVQQQPDGAFHLEALDIVQDARSRFVGHVSSIGAAVARHEVHIRQVGEDACSELVGVYVPSGTQQHDHPILIEHLARGGVSRQAYRGVIDDRAHGVFNGRIIVHPGAAGINADQSNRNLLLSDHAEADTRPRLEIYADDVACTHGAAVGRLDEDSLFYLRSRGIGIDEARRVLTYAFVEELVDRLGEGPMRDHVEGLVSARLHPDPARRQSGEQA